MPAEARMKHFLICLILAAVPAVPSFAEGAAKDLRPYYTALYSGDYRSALDKAAAAAARDQGAALAADLFRIDEAAVYAETAPFARDAFLSLLRSENVSSSQLAGALAKTLLIAQFARTGERSKAEDLRTSEGYPSSLRVMGPFRVGGEEDLKQLSTAVAAGLESQSYDMIPDEQGVFCFHALNDDVSGCAFAAETFLSLGAEADVLLSTGCSGYTDLYVDGVQVLTERAEKRFFPLQKMVRLRLSKGGHRISAVVASASRNELSFSMSFKGTKPVNGAPADGKLLSSGFAAGFAELDGGNFDKGYCLVRSGYVSRRDAGKFLDLVGTGNSDDLEWALARFWRASGQSKPEIRDRLLREAAAGGAAGAWAELARLSFDEDRFASGSGYVDLFADACPHSPGLIELKILRAACADWTEEAVSLCGSMTRAGYPSAAAALTAKVLGRSGHSRAEYEALTKAYAFDQNDPEITDKLVSAAAGAPDLSAIERAAADHPWNVNIAVSLAEKVFSIRGADEALPFVTSALRRSPFHSRALFLAGEIYLSRGDRTLAENYMSRAVELTDREDFRQRYEIVFGQGRRSSADDIEAWDAASSKWPNEPAVCVANDTDIVVYDDGSSVTSVREVYRVFSRERAKSLDERSVIVDRNSDELVELIYRAVSNGSIVQSDDIRTQDLSDPDSRIYVDMTEYSIKAPYVKPGRYLVFEYVLRSTAGRSLKGYYGTEKFFDPSIRSLGAKLTVTSSRPVKMKGYRCTPAVVSGKAPDGRMKTTVSVGPIAPVRDEPGMRPYADRAPTLVMTTFSDWKEFHDWFTTQITDRQEITASMKKEIDAICAGTSRTEDTVAKIYSYVTDRIRYVGDEAGLGGYIPRTVSETWENKAGDCKDIALLLAVLLRSQGIAADIALLRTADMGTADLTFPSLNSFNHAICRVALKNPLYLDGTVRKAGILDLPQSDRDVDALVIGRDKPFSERIAGSRYSAADEIAETVMTIQPDLSAVCSRTVVRRGTLASGDDDPSSADGSNLSRYWTKLYPGAEVKDMTRTGGSGIPLLTRYTIELPSFAQKTDGELFIPAALVPFSLYDSFGRSVNRENDLYLGEPRESLVKMRCILPEGYEVTRLPADADLSFGGIRLVYAFKKEGRSGFTVFVRLSAKRSVIATKDYGALREFLSRCALVEGSFICAAKGASK